MKQDPFGDLNNWEAVLDILDELANAGKLPECQAGLIRILKHKGNWRLREEVLKRVGEIQRPSHQLIHQVLSILDDDNTYYDARILAGDALIQMLKNRQDDFGGKIIMSIRNVTERLKMIPHPSIFENAVKKLCAEIAVFGERDDQEKNRT